ncbi:MAG: glycerol-3-phosphate acyltransferase [Clostridia bacterium]|nr:glycerol-3-phosphate acyltransferase [Clostridia bacterium]
MTIEIILYILAAIVVGYLLGSINFAVIISSLKHDDIRKKGSGNPGAMNMIRNFGVILGGLTLFCDALKSAVACMIIALLLKFSAIEQQLAYLITMIAGVSAFVGHIFPLYYKFKGGKAVSVSAGIFAYFCPVPSLICFIGAVLFITITKIGSVGSFLMIFSMSVCFVVKLLTSYSFDLIYNVALIAIAAMIFVIVVIRHKENIKRLINGTENKTIIFNIDKK